MKFGDWIKVSGMTQGKFAKKVGISQSAVNHLAKGRKNPSLDLMLRIEKETKGKVRRSDWLLAEKAIKEKA